MAELAEPVVSFLLENIGRLVAEEAQFLAGVSDQAEQIQSKLRLMLSLLRDADSRQFENSLIREWISQSKDAAYDVENALETFAFKVASRRGKGITNLLKRYSCVFSECYLRHRVGSEIQNLHNRISDLTKSFHEYGIRTIMERGEVGTSSRQEQPIRRMYSFVEEEDFVGLIDDVQLLVQQLTNEHEVSHDNVVSICGMGGLGKTTIARKVYNHPNVRQHFDAFSWVSISQQWQAKDILQRLLVKIMPENSEQIFKWTEEYVVRRLYEILQSKRCLIVLDDIWARDAWDHLKNALPTERSGSKILLTTRITSVATYIGPYGFHHEPRLLSEDESWDLLQKKALKRRSFDPDIEELGKEIAKCCRGLPLAVVVIGGILATKHEFNQWEFVHKNIKSLLEKGENIGQGGDFLKILALSYNDLPYQLKPCFLYLSIYPEDFDIKTERLYQLWMAEGMVSKEDRIDADESMMDVAERYLGDLVKRCMIQVTLNKGGPALRKFKSCRLHDLMRDLCLAKARDENFLKVVDYRGENIDPELGDWNSSSSKCRRIVIFLNGEDASKYVPPEKEMMKHARSLTLRIFHGGESYEEGLMASTKFNDLKMLRALTIEGMPPYPGHKLYDFICTVIQMFKLEIGNLIHLRYLCLNDSGFIVLPSSLGNLQHLETLDLGKAPLLLLRNVLFKMINLRHLYLPKDNQPFFNVVSTCPKLQLAGLTKLEILENFNPRYCVFEDLYKLRSLRVLKVQIIWLKNDYEKIINFISDSQRLKEASVNLVMKEDVLHSGKWSARGMDQDFLNSEKWSALLNKLFCSHLCHLYLEGRLRVLPEYKTNFFRNLVELELRKSFIETNLMETLEKLPNLRSLWLRYGAFLGREMICSSTGFPRLRFLLLSDLPNLKEWSVERGAMTNLSCLEIEDCPNLEMIPDGLQFVRKIKELKIRGMPKRFCDRLRNIGGEKGEDFDKIRHISSIVIQS